MPIWGYAGWVPEEEQAEQTESQAQKCKPGANEKSDHESDQSTDQKRSAGGMRRRKGVSKVRGKRHFNVAHQGGCL